jgi:hypothetical protein
MGGAARTAQDHRYDQCGDEDCPRFPCQVFREGRQLGEVLGYRRGYAEGFAEGIRSCPRPHGNG